MNDRRNQDIILCYGHDEALLGTQQQVLEEMGIPISFATTLPSFHDRICTGQPALIVLCHTLSAEECAREVSFATEHSPASKLLIMYSKTGGYLYSKPEQYHLHNEHAEFFSVDGPALMATLKNLIPMAMQEECP